MGEAQRRAAAHAQEQRGAKRPAPRLRLVVPATNKKRGGSQLASRALTPAPPAAPAAQVTKESTWVRPAILGWKVRPQRARVLAPNHLVLGLVDPQSPPLLARAPAQPAQAAEKGFWHNNVTGESTWKQPDAMGVSTPDGKSRYWIVDGEPSWQPPAEYAWRAVPSTDPSHNGRVRARAAAAAAAAAAACVAGVVVRAPAG
jgi:hypothetical protein